MFDTPIDTKVLVFDLHGTLVDRDRGLREALAREAGIGEDSAATLVAALDAAEDGILPELEEFRPCREVLAGSLVRAAEHVGLDLPPARAAVVAAGMPDWPLVPGVAGPLARLSGRYRLAAIANADGDDLSRTLARMPVPFEHAVAADRVGCYLPEPDHLLALLHEMVVDEHEVLVVSGGPGRAILPAAALGIPAARVDPGDGPPPEDLPVLHRVKTLAELADRLVRERRRGGRVARRPRPR